MDKSETKVSVVAEGNEVVIRHGQAKEIKAPVLVSERGTIGIIGEYLKKYADKVNSETIVIVDRDKLTITYKENPKDPDGTLLVAALEISKEYKKLGVNSGNSMTAFDLANLLRMNRSFFESKEKAMELVHTLRNFEATINKEVTDKNDSRANVTLLKKQAVSSNLPEGFHVKIPVFKGKDPESIEVEIDIDATDLSCQLVSPAAQEVIQTITDFIVDGEVEEIRKLTDDKVPILEV